MIPLDKWNLDIDDDTLELRNYYESSLFEFAKYVNPFYMYGDIHEEVFNFLERTEHSDPGVRRLAENQLLLLPRGHLKSHCLAVYVCWKITREPWTTVVYLTAGEDLGKIQMGAIKGILESEEYMLLWPDMFKENESDRNKWTTFEINTDHPVRKERRIRDYTVIIKTIGSSATGLHCDVLIDDDLVVPGNAYTDLGRKTVADAVSDYAAIKNTGAITKAAGTRYDEKDIYGSMIEAEVPTIDMETGEQTGSFKQWQVMSKAVEDKGDGLGRYLWPRTQSAETELWYGFDFNELIRKKTEMISLGGTLLHFNSQYYNDPNKREQGDHSGFQYYSRKGLNKVGDNWYYGEKKLEITAACDLAWTDETAKNSKRADYTAMVVIGIDEDGFIYILDAKRFKTDKYSVYYRNLSQLYDFWKFRKFYVESESAGKFILEDMKKQVRENSLNLVVVGRTVSRTMSKEERAAAILETRYESNIILHYKGGVMSELEQQLTQLRPRWDDLRDALALAVQEARKPLAMGKRKRKIVDTGSHRNNTRFGGRRR